MTNGQQVATRLAIEAFDAISDRVAASGRRRLTMAFAQC